MADREAVEEHQHELFAIAYRMLGSVTEAEDVVQETFLRWSQMEDPSGIERPGAWLTTVLTRLCVDVLRSARVQREHYVGPWLPEPLVGEDPDPADDAAMAESLSLAFLVVLETLSPAERAVFLLHDVFGYPFEDIAPALDRSPAACRQLASRARRHLDERRPRYEADRATRNAVARSFIAACAGADVDGLLEVLAPDVVLRSDGGGLATAARRPVRGADRVARFIVGLARQAPPDLTAEVREVNGTPGLLVSYDGRPQLLLGVDVADGQVVAVHALRNPEKLAASLH